MWMSLKWNLDLVGVCIILLIYYILLYPFSPSWRVDGGNGSFRPQLKSGKVSHLNKDSNVHTSGAYVYRIDKNQIMDGMYHYYVYMTGLEISYIVISL